MSVIENIAPRLFPMINNDNNIVPDTNINTVQRFLIWWVFYNPLHSYLRFFMVFIILSFLPKYVGALSMLGLLGYELNLDKFQMAFESFKPVDGMGYWVPIYANYVIASICLAMNYEIQVNPSTIQLTRSVSGSVGEDQNETIEENKETPEAASDNSESENGTDAKSKGLFKRKSKECLKNRESP